MLFLRVGEKSLLPSMRIVHEFPEFPAGLTGFFTHLLKRFFMALFIFINAPALAFEKLHLHFKQASQSSVEGFEFLFRLQTVDSILLLSGSQTRLALNNELDCP